MAKITIALVGSTQHTLDATAGLLNHPNFEIVFVITPAGKPQGKTGEICANPVQTWAGANHLPIVLIEDQFDDLEQAQVQTIIQKTKTPDFLLVVDFGYKLPSWLLTLVKYYPINIHPSDLPRWRGSSPGQFVLLYGEKISAVSIISMSSKFDQGEIVTQLPFDVMPSWTQTEYYQTGFQLVAQQLPQTLQKLAKKEISPKPQPVVSPTPLARRLTKTDAFIPWSMVWLALIHPISDQLPVSTQPVNTAQTHQLGSVLTDAYHELAKSEPFPLARLIENATRAFQPWPQLWTIIPTTKGEKRMKILSTTLGQNGLIALERVQIEGQQPATWNQVKNQLAQRDII